LNLPCSEAHSKYFAAGFSLDVTNSAFLIA
jgi:hypothetical protein